MQSAIDHRVDTRQVGYPLAYSQRVTKMFVELRDRFLPKGTLYNAMLTNDIKDTHVLASRSFTK